MDQRAIRPRALAAALLCASLVVPLAAHSQSSKVRSVNQRVNVGAPLDANSEVEVFVQLDQPSVAEKNIDAVEATGALASAAEQKAQAARVSAQQASFKAALEARGAHILSSLRIGANGFRVKVPASEVSVLRTLPGVRSVGRVELHKPDNVESVPWIGSPAVWAAVGRGEGVKVGIIDTGIDYTHADFGGSGNPADAVLPVNDPNVIEPGTFPTAKVVGGWDFAGATYDANVTGSVPTPDGDPMDGAGHGSHVAGTVAGIGTPAIGAGVAPGASLYALKVFGDGGGSTNLTSDAIEWALDPNGDGDMSDHLDVINMSLGSPFGEPTDPSAISSSNAARLGIIVVASAGNEGGVYSYITGAPGVSAQTISVAANSPGGRLYAKFTVTQPAAVAGVKQVAEGSGPVTLASTGTISGPLVVGSPADGCTALTNASDVAGKIVLVARGTCNFTVKYATAAAAGARAVVVANNAAGAPIVMAAAGTTIPGVMITNTDGAALAAATGVAVTLEAALDPSKDDLIADFSSLGPGMGGSSFKPDLTAPGVSIVSVATQTGTGSANFQGTSMAAPHVAGAAALLHQKYPKLRPAAIKALLQNSTVDSNASGDTRLTRQGVGAVRVDKAAALSSYASPAGISFGRVNPLFTAYLDEKVTLKDLSGKRRTFNVTHVPNQTYPGVSVGCPSRLTVSGKGETKFQVTFKFDPRVAWKKGIGDDAYVSQTEVDGWCVLSDGKDTLRVGYIAVVDPASAVVVLPDNGLNDVKIQNLGPGFGWVEGFTLAKLGGEQQNRTYGSIAATGFRRGNPAGFGGINVIELALALERPFEHPSNLFIDFEADTNGDGVTDYELLASDLSTFFDVEPGQFVTFQYQNGALVADWYAVWDYNDRGIILPFSFAGQGFDAFATEKFRYTLTVSDREGNEDVQHGTVDLSKEIVPDLNTFGLDPDDKVEVDLEGPNGTSLWLLPNNIAIAQPALSVHVVSKKGPKKKHSWHVRRRY